MGTGKAVHFRVIGHVFHPADLVAELPVFLLVIVHRLYQTGLSGRFQVQAVIQALSSWGRVKCCCPEPDSRAIANKRERRNANWALLFLSPLWGRSAEAKEKGAFPEPRCDLAERRRLVSLHPELAMAVTAYVCGTRTECGPIWGSPRRGVIAAFLEAPFRGSWRRRQTVTRGSLPRNVLKHKGT